MASDPLTAPAPIPAEARRRHRPLPTLSARGASLAQPAAQRAHLKRLALGAEVETALAEAGVWPLTTTGIEVLQINVGKLCNQTCRHCHVDAGPDRGEVMDRETMELCVAALARTHIPTVDITGGAPELNPGFRWLVEQCRALGRHVIDRCNLTVLTTNPGRDLPDFFAAHEVELVCSLPHYRALSTDRQRGEGVFERSLQALRRLNEVGYGDGRSGLRLVLVTNPAGAYLPGAQESLQREWMGEMERRYGIRFDALYTITNMPISRYLEWLLLSGNLEAYMDKLVSAFNPVAARGVMCRSMVSVAWNGTLHDCDFNQMLEMPLAPGLPRHIRDFDLAALSTRPVAVDRHCFGCTAGFGSSCGGSIS